MKKAWFWSCHQVPIYVIGSLPVTKKSAKFVAGNKIYDIFQRHYVLWNGFFFVAAKKFVAGIQFATSFGSDNVFMKRPPVSPTGLFWASYDWGGGGGSETPLQISAPCYLFSELHIFISYDNLWKLYA